MEMNKDSEINLSCVQMVCCSVLHYVCVASQSSAPEEEEDAVHVEYTPEVLMKNLPCVRDV